MKFFTPSYFRTDWLLGVWRHVVLSFRSHNGQLPWQWSSSSTNREQGSPWRHIWRIDVDVRSRRLALKKNPQELMQKLTSDTKEDLFFRLILLYQLRLVLEGVGWGRLRSMISLSTLNNLHCNWHTQPKRNHRVIVRYTEKNQREIYRELHRGNIITRTNEQKDVWCQHRHHKKDPEKSHKELHSGKVRTHRVERSQNIKTVLQKCLWLEKNSAPFGFCTIKQIKTFCTSCKYGILNTHCVMTLSGESDFWRMQHKHTKPWIFAV